MTEFEAVHLHTMGASAAAGTLPSTFWTDRTRRRCLVAVTLLAADLGAGLAGVSIAAALTTIPLVTAIPLVAVLCSLQGILGLYGGFGPCPCERLRLRAYGIMLLALIDRVTGFHALAAVRPGFDALACPLLLVFGYYTERHARAFLIRHDLWGARAAFIGCGAANQRLARDLQQHPEFGLAPAGFVRMANEGMIQGPLSLPLLGDMADLERMASRIEILVFGSAADAMVLSQEVRQRLNAAELVLLTQSDEVQSLGLTTRTLCGLIGGELRRESVKRWNCRVKRCVDLAVAIPACMISALIVALAALAIRVTDGGPAFYFQNRVGLHGRNIRICKLRTMYKDAEKRLESHLAFNPEAQAEWQRFFKLTMDPRILPGVGTFLRRTSLDELPQLWSVFRGDMSLVGPRPFPSYHVSSFDPEFQSIRSSVAPGLSGLWQVGARSNGDLAVQRAQDLFYVLNWSIWLDLYVLLETPAAVITGQGAK